MKTFDVSAIPHDGFDGYNRAGKRWNATPTTVTVRDGELKPGEELAANEVTADQLAELRADPRIKVYPSGGADPVATERAPQGPKAAPPIKADASKPGEAPHKP